MASQETDTDGLSLDLWPFDFIDDDLGILIPDHVIDETGLDQLRLPGQGIFDDNWWFSPQSDSDISLPSLQIPDNVNETGGASNDFSSVLLPAPNGPSCQASDEPLHSLEQNTTSGTSSSRLPTAGHFRDSLHRVGSATPPKIGARFTTESLRILKGWLAAHSGHPYPDETQKRLLQEQTGLNKTQITNWLANARRRSKNSISQTESPRQLGQPQPMAIPARPGTPAIRHDSPFLNPLERWVESPPEHEPASASAIAMAVATNSSLYEDSTGSHNLDQYGDFYSTPSAGSVDTSLSSGGSFSSANSSQKQLKSLEPFRHSRSRRSRKRAFKRNGVKTPLGTVDKMFQCTFCTETFGRKYDWQRHENSLHLPLERWVCAPNGPRSPNPANGGLPSCVFCGLVNPSDEHDNIHHYQLCQSRSLGERTFTRKDHLRQHLRLFHDVGFSEWSMQQWRVPTPSIRSRCGFCDASMSTWDERADHISNHFKLGKTMASWEGDWGFEQFVLRNLENAIPPYLIETERHSPYPYQGSRAPAETPRNAYEFIKIELAYYMQKHFDKKSKLPTVENMQLEACRIILASVTGVQRKEQTPASWLRDLILSDHDILQRARLWPIRSPLESRLTPMKINGKQHLFEECPFEAQLKDYIRDRTSEKQITNEELQEETCRIVERMEKGSLTPSSFITGWLVQSIRSSTHWLADFCNRMGIPKVNDGESSKDLDLANVLNEDAQLECVVSTQAEMSLMTDIAPGNSTTQMQHQPSAMEITDHIRPQTETEFWSEAFNSFPASTRHAPMHTTVKPGLGSDNSTDNCEATTESNDQRFLRDARAMMMSTNGFYLGGPNFYRWIGEELRRWAVATMSPHNPTRHIPTDEEIAHYARWIAYNDGDPLNQTFAENPYWLACFKRDVGIPDS
ncbi:hypothetical protein FZEAL_5597 [Fusarium zealandicum]|uniref:Monocarboxylate transporter 4 n=1 Tax=Fusarium zealandicum TaxID=1053134 RepID=A0A8H4UK81_9HYPO|nr:hypothetical protein FZEAL_5597 [Fusarium zealandicum]